MCIILCIIECMEVQKMKYELTSGAKVINVEWNGKKFCNNDERGIIHKGIDGWDVRSKTAPRLEKVKTFTFLSDAINYLYDINMSE